ncbi:bifunctional 4-hydroxy-2-oxoglutarate aldolase/2-dehydro-3-deoxy-phosphogluconate aldolase [Abyssalbus ytuae]|uniref:Bifunctional 4-hydroxy-2-oxoglutarate aldolase/2-dehydro-3-deoxy-phosphogluconate aldolase n=1 Tax=Abyssalbus ytuae TaxID=2926907 RepID=A0A9E6ZNC4_9FLAO|nr:bifunctional 4-hydroxy-2-oxoglutarate aldolase/2-dehydro-3-deoxy-phosphogluconate aldolase [Abyssalbus ytuae]UOB19094.1 bifunctional 4-hydroxy-2-oxoglutarate aldolase/2-dehydro-3-deoxy-phosphogluconate aldolase [Abyssalbus ytuae]
MRFSRIEVVLQMEATGLVPLFYHSRPEVAQRVVKACYDGGARLLEFTHRGLFAQEVFNELSKYCIEHCPDMILGVGSVSDAGTASHYMNMGACFVVTPAFREDIALVCNRRKVLWSPGCGSLTEINRAEELGCEVVKLFPGEVYGPEFIKSVKAPQPWTKIMPTGGVDTTEENLKGWFGAGATCVGMGSRLITKDIVENRQYGLLEEKVREVLEIIKKIKK